jgi:protein involved in polysaccharide export with SLBB domain
MRRSGRAARLLVIACGAASMISVPGGVVAQSAPTTSSSVATLRPGDTIRLRVWREPDLSGDFMVNENGNVTLPRLGVRSVRDVPIDSLRARLVRDYAQFIREVSIELTPLYRVSVTGAVRNPGLFTVDPTMSVGDAIGLAGGVAPQGRAGHVALVRDGRRVSTSITPSSRLAELALRSGDELHVPERAWLSRNAGVLLGAVSTAVSLVWALRQ